jgi:hypothetical protein
MKDAPDLLRLQRRMRLSTKVCVICFTLMPITIMVLPLSLGFSYLYEAWMER